jgi:hypothetical protein
MKDFLKGALFISVFLPIVSGVISLFNQFIEYLCTCIAVKTYEIQKDLVQPEGQEVQNVIGFQIPSNDYYDDDDYEGEE